MYLLDKNQKSIIETDVARARITLSNLSHELIDHICCEVEDLINNGKSFEEAYTIVKAQTGIRTLQQIQENTLYLIDKNYALMKNMMKISGNISLALIGIGTVIKIYHWPGANIALVLGFTLLCLIFFPAAIYLNYKEGKTKGRVALNFSILFGGILLMVGILFKVMHWPGSGPLLLAGWSLIIWIFMPLLLFVKLKDASTKKEKRIAVLGIIALMIFEISTLFKMMHWPGAAPLFILGSILMVSLFLPLFTYIKFRESGKITGHYIFLIIASIYATVLTALLAMNVSKNELSHFVNAASNSAQIVRYFEEKKNQHNITTLASDSLGSGNNPRAKVITKEADKLSVLIEGIKLDLIQMVEHVDKPTAEEYLSDLNRITAKDNTGAVNHLLIGREGNGLAKSLKQELAVFKKMILSATSSDPTLSAYMDTLLDASNKQDHPESLSWEEINFRNNAVISTIALLTYMEKNIRIAESETIRHIRQ